MKRLLPLILFLCPLALHSQSSFLIPVQTTTGQGISGATVTLTCTDTTNGCVGKGPFSATSMNGNAAFTAIPAGNYTVAITGPNLTTFSYAYTVGSQPTGGTINPSNLGGIVVVDGLIYPKTQVGIQNAVNVAGCNGKVLLTPGVYNLTDTSAAQEILLGNAVGVANCGIDFGGPGGEGTVILQYATNVPNTEDIIRVSPGSSTATFGVYLHDFFIQPVSASTTAARYGINFDETNGLIAHVTVERVRVGLNASNLQSNYAVFNTNTVPSCNPLFLATFRDNTFWGGVNFNNIGDSVLFERNNITGPRDFTVQTVSVGCHSDGGAHGLQILANNLTPVGGTVIKNAWQGWFAYNDVEATVTSTETNNALIDLQGLMANPTENFVIEGNYLGANSAFVADSVRVDQAYHTIIKHNYITRGSGVSYRITANANSTDIFGNTQAPNGEAITTWLADLGTGTQVDYLDPTTRNRVITNPSFGTNGSTNRVFGAPGGTQVRTAANIVNGFSSGNDVVSTGLDGGFSRLQAGGLALGNGSFQDFTGFLKQTGGIDAGTSKAVLHIANQGTACTNGELALSAGWQSTGSATVTAVAGLGQTCSWTVTTGTTTAANPTITDTLTNALPAATVRCWMFLEYGPASTHTAAAGEGFAQTTLSTTAPVFTFNGTPTAAGKTYLVVRTCGP